MLTQLEHQMARSLASAVNDESERWKQTGFVADWFQDAYDAIELYNEQVKQELMDKNRNY